MKKITKIDELPKVQPSNNRLKVAVMPGYQQTAMISLSALKPNGNIMRATSSPIQNGSLQDFIMTRVFQAPERKGGQNYFE